MFTNRMLHFFFTSSDLHDSSLRETELMLHFTDEETEVKKDKDLLKIT